MRGRLAVRVSERATANFRRRSSRNLLTNHGEKMKVLSKVSAGALCLFMAAGAAYAQDVQQTPPAQMNQPTAQQNPAPTAEQMRDTSVGGVPGQRTQTGGRTLYGAPCNAGTFCDIYHGNYPARCVSRRGKFANTAFGGDEADFVSREGARQTQEEDDSAASMYQVGLRN
jgi:hypothetical protein